MFDIYLQYNLLSYYNVGLHNVDGECSCVFIISLCTYVLVYYIFIAFFICLIQFYNHTYILYSYRMLFRPVIAKQYIHSNYF